MKASLAASAYLLLSASAALCQQQESLSPDLALNFSCKIAPSEEAIEKFLKLHDFEVANPERVRRQLQRSFFLLDIEALDKRSWIVTFRGSSIPAVQQKVEGVFYTVGVNSPPPTQHDRNLEEAIISFVSNDLDCQITSNGRYENPVGATDFFRLILSNQKSRIYEAEICDKATSTYDVGKCDKVPGVKQ